MLATKFVDHLRQTGIQLEVAGDNLRARPLRLLTDQIRAQITTCKQEILACLEAEEAAAERAAIMEFDGGMDRQTAETVAALAQDFYRHLFGPAKASGCCYAPAARYCREGQRLRDQYYLAAAAHNANKRKT